MTTRRIIALGAVVVLSALLAGCRPDLVFYCEDSSQCGDGVCGPAGFCGFADGNCEDGFRYGENAGDGLSGECIAAVDAGPDAEEPDAMPIDAMPPCGAQGCSCLSSVAAGGWHTCATVGADQVHCWGRDFDGQVGDGGSCDDAATSPSVGIPVLIGTGTALAGGSRHACELDDTGAVRCWGDNERSQVGCPAASNVCEPTAGGVPRPSAQIDLGNLHSCLRDSGNVFCWGQNNTGQLGIGTASPTTSCSPGSAVGLGGTALDLSAGGATTCAIAMGSSTRVMCWGGNIHGECGTSPAVGTPGCSPGTTGMPAGACGSPQEVLAATSANEIAVGDGHVCAHVPGSGYLCWGDNSEGAVGVGTLALVEPPQSVTGFPVDAVPQAVLALGDDHSCALVDLTGQTGAVFCWGANGAGQLGESAIGLPRSVVPVQIMETASAPLVDIASITAGARHTCAHKTDGTIYCWGDNSCGQLGDGQGGNCNDTVLPPVAMPVPLPVIPLLTCP